MSRNRATCMLYLFLGVLASPLAAQASPIQAGSIQVAGSAQFTHTRDIGNDQGWTEFDLTPRLGYFLARGLALNAHLQFQRISAAGNHQTGWGFGPGLSYFVDVHSRHFYPFISGRTLLAWDNSSTEVLGAGNFRQTNRVWLVSGGGLFMLGQHVGLSGELFYQHEHFTSRPGSGQVLANSSETYGLQWGVAAFIF